MKILVTGATGFIGQKLCEKLKDDHEVYAPVRSLKSAEKKLPGVKLISWADIHSPFEIETQELDVVINLMGENIAGGRWTSDRKKALYDSRIVGTKNLFAQLKSVKINTVIQASAVGFYGNSGSRQVDEESSAGEGFLAKICENWENEAKIHKDQYQRLCIFRLGVVLGKGGGALEKMLPAFKFGVAGKLGDGQQYMPWIHRDDVIGMMVKAINDSSWNGIFNAVSPNPKTNEEFTKTLGDVLGRPTILPAPAFALKLILGDMSQVVLQGQNAQPKRALEGSYQFKFEELKPALSSIVSGA